MTNYVHALRGGQDAHAALNSLEVARLGFRDSYAESQMVFPDAVLRAATTAKTALNTAYGTLRKYGAEPSVHAEELAVLEGTFHEQVWPYLGH